VSAGRSDENWEWAGLAAGGLVGVMLILLANVVPVLVLFESFALLNILSFIGIILSPFALNVPLLWSSESRRFRVAVIFCYVALALVVGWMIAFLARGDNYYGLIVIPSETSWIVVMVIAVLLLIPIINWLSLVPMAAWLGSLLYYKVYPGSYVSRALINSPLFALPLVVLLGYGVCQVIRARREMVYIFDTVTGEFTSHRSPRRRIPIRRVLAVSSLLLLGSSAVVTGFAMWNEQEETKIVRLGDFQACFVLTHESCYLCISFSLINARNKTTVMDGMGELSYHDRNGSLICKDKFSFFKGSFQNFKYANCEKWMLTYTLSGDNFLAAVVSKDVSVADLTTGYFQAAMDSAYAILKVSTANSGEPLSAMCPLSYDYATESLIRFYYRDARASAEVYRSSILEKLMQWLEQNRYSISMYGNLGWPLDITVMDIVVLGKNAWGVGYLAGIGGYGHILHSSDGGITWEIQWKSSTYGPNPFKVVFLNETEGWVAANKVLLHTTDGGITWNAIWSRTQLFGGYIRTFQVTDQENLQIGLSGEKALYTSDGGKTWQPT
jgi:hypothetical protein